MVSQFLNSCLLRKLLNSKTGLLFVLFLCACSSEKNDISGRKNELTLTRYSRLLSIQKNENIWNVTINNPWQNTNDTQLKYRFSEDKSNDSCIHIPLKKVVCFSSSHVAMISLLDQQQTIAGVSGLHFICDSTVVRMANEGLIWEAGFEDNINYELFLKEKPDVALIYGVGTEHARYVARLEKLGIKVIYIAEYLENHPLGRLEWIRLFGILFNEYEKADSIFREKSALYENTCISITEQSKLPLVFSGSPIGDNWYIPGGDSYMAHLIKDAGGKFIFIQNHSNESYPVALENAYRHLLSADIWINCDIPADVVYAKDSRYRNTPPVIQGRVYSHNLRSEKGKGDDFWESGTVNPEIILKDLIYIFHPDSMKDYHPVYYQKL